MWSSSELSIPEVTVPKEVLLSVCARFFMKEFSWTPQMAHANAINFFNFSKALNFSPTYRGNWYVHGVRYPDGTHGLVGNQSGDGMWRIIKFPRDGFYPSREVAARRELELAFREWNKVAQSELQKGSFNYGRSQI